MAITWRSSEESGRRIIIWGGGGGTQLGAIPLKKMIFKFQFHEKRDVFAKNIFLPQSIFFSSSSINRNSSSRLLQKSSLAIDLWKKCKQIADDIDIVYKMLITYKQTNKQLLTLARSSASRLWRKEGFKSTIKSGLTFFLYCNRCLEVKNYIHSSR